LSDSIRSFGAFEVDLHAYELRKRGVKIRLQDQPFQILAMLLERPGVVVTREELRQKLWSAETFVDFDHGLNNAINRLREARSDSAENPRFIETLPRRGYRFIAPVEVMGSAHHPRPLFAEQDVPTPAVVPLPVVYPASNGLPPGRDTDKSPVAPLCKPPTDRDSAAANRFLLRFPSRQITLAVLGVTLISVGFAWFTWHWKYVQRGIGSGGAIQSLAVLPLENVSGQTGQDYFADGMTDELITELAKISGLRVISRTSVMQYRGEKKPVPEVARELKVDAVVEGTLLRAGDRVRITAQLIRAVPEKHLWSESYERDPRNILDLQREVARAIASEVRVKLTSRERAGLSSTRPVDPVAYETYLRGLYFWNKRTEQDLQKGIECFNQAVHRDPSYALAYATLANAYNSLGIYAHLPPRKIFPKARAAALKALALDDTLAEAHAALCVYDSNYEWDQPGSGKRTGRNTYKVRHPTWSFDANGHLNGTILELEEVTLDAGGDSYRGTFVTDVFDPVTKLLTSETKGVIRASRIRVD
jgi:TolB-like protein/DNA-binding winged helix-turn-helix (wHTH) protein